jgi:hypothetical protein
MLEIARLVSSSIRKSQMAPSKRPLYLDRLGGEGGRLEEREAAVDFDDRAGHETGGFAGQENGYWA